MRDEFVVNLKGKRFVTWPGLLDAAHQRGLESIETGIEQIPTPDNGNVAIVHATVRITSADGGSIQSFEGLGDASPDNVSRGVAAHCLRVAETRAKARALRDAVNVSEALMDDASTLEEPRESPVRESEPETDPQYQKTGGYPQSEARQAQTPQAREFKPARKSQTDLLKTLAVEWRGEGGVERLEERIGKSLGQLSRQEADDWIDRLTPEENA